MKKTKDNIINSTYYTIDGKIYALDMEAFIAFVSRQTPNEKQVTTNINQYYDKGASEDGIPIKTEGVALDIQSKEINETKISSNETFVNVRYDFIRNLMTILMTTPLDINNEPIDTFGIGQKIAFNTLLNEGVLIEING